MQTPKAHELLCRKVLGGKRPLWQAYCGGQSDASASLHGIIIGAGNTADNAIKDYQAEFRRRAKLTK